MSRSARRIEQRKAKETRQHEAFLSKDGNRRLFGPLTPRNQSQANAIRLLESKRIVFLTGFSGTGKTFLSTSNAVERFQREDFDRIVITRPMVGCDEEIGFLPGTEKEKFEGWVEPFMEIVRSKLGKALTESLVEAGKIVAVPLMRMRGSTFRRSIVIMDEAQNTTPGQMKMFLTRVGEGATVFILGDEEQSDLPAGKANGLSDALDVFKGSNLIGHHAFTEEDITRDPLVREIVKSYRRKRA